MGQVLQLAVELTSVDCGCCGGTYAINQRYHQKAYQDGTSWTCPYCKTRWGYAGNGENARLKKELEAERARKQAALDRANEAEAEKLKLERDFKRAAKRTAAGVCPCCPRTFVNLQRHIATKHPEYNQEKK